MNETSKDRSTMSRTDLEADGFEGFVPLRALPNGGGEVPSLDLPVSAR